MRRHWKHENTYLGREGCPMEVLVACSNGLGSCRRTPLTMRGFTAEVRLDFDLTRHETVGRPGGWPKIGHSYGEYYYIIGLKAPGNYSASFWSNKVPCFIMGKSNTSKFHDFWISGPLESRIYSFKSLLYQIASKNTKTRKAILGNTMFVNLAIKFGSFEILKPWNSSTLPHSHIAI